MILRRCFTRLFPYRRQFGQNLRREVDLWEGGAILGLAVIGLVIATRLTGGLQNTELRILDYLLRLRPDESIDERIVIIGIDEADIQEIGRYPIPDQDLAQLLQTVQQYQPVAIGLDLFRDLPVPPGYTELINTFQASQNLIGIEKLAFTENEDQIKPPPLPPEQVSFVNTLLDSDGAVRRSLLGASDLQNGYKFSFTLRLAEQYLAKHQIGLENGIQDQESMRFGTTELARVQPNTGAYIGADTGGNQILINFRAGAQPFRMVSIRELKAGILSVEQIRDRVVLIGVTASSIGDVVNSAAIKSRNPGLVSGVELQAHAVSQILSAVLDKRPLLKSWAEGWEYAWIIVWGLLGISLGRLFAAPLKLLIVIAIVSSILVIICYGMLIAGWWIPLVPPLLAFTINGAGLTTALFYRHQQRLQTQLQERRQAIEQTFTTIHNGPLQTLASLLRDPEAVSPQVYATLKQLDRELRDAYELVQQQALAQDHFFAFSKDLYLDLNNPLHEVLYQVYDQTLTRDFPHFKTLKLRIPTFAELDEQHLNHQQKQDLCRFLEEALCNIGKHAVGVTRIEVCCQREEDYSVIRIKDNGTANLLQHLNSKEWHSGRGTKQAKDLSRQIGGQFNRYPNSPQGTVCELTWTTKKTRSWHF